MNKPSPDDPAWTGGAASVARATSPWSARQKLARALWYVVEATLFRLSPRPCYRWRNWLLRRFGGRVAPSARIRSTVAIEIPWHLTVAPDVIVGDHVILYCLGPVSIGARTTVSQYCHLCAGTHDYSRPDFPLLPLPITIGSDAWLAADVFVGPGVIIGDGTVVGARSSVFADLPPWKVCVGTPARPIKDRVMRA
ncbi:MAG TPA: WcaF family extracellular polysaccharide biosynthesis acetyltransferase [Gemmataceae bacterium]|jgi:putative colanic acid biosynthesis acetyltransferase WcaF|nr:WcaF family extracellular polysaccharide biosynthesis acetyltransferase [Gemmataceae bacterium]